jgi:two-component system, chemotaxis family, protein-glutamate methylesterase/glutaminase
VAVPAWLFSLRNDVIRVLVVDDSAVVRKVLTDELSQFDDIQVVGSAIDPYQARDKIVALEPDVLTLDIEMPRMDGLSFLAKLMKHHPIPTVIVSSLTTENNETAVRALHLGAVEVVPKPGSQFSVPDVATRLVRAVRAAARARVRPVPREDSGPSHLAALPDSLETTRKVLAIGASTGGTQAIERVLKRFPVNAPGTVIVQHMPAGFTASFAERLDGICAIAVREAKTGDIIGPGLALIAPGGYHLLVERSGAQFRAVVREGPPVNRHKPSVEVLFRSLARSAKQNCSATILTGMGADGARGLLELRQSGAFTVAQDEESSVVFGMPAAAIKLGAAEMVRPLDEIAKTLLESMHARQTAGAR